jgi:ribonuclease T1
VAAFTPPTKRTGFVWWAPLVLVLAVVAVTWLLGHRTPPPSPSAGSGAASGSVSQDQNTPDSGLPTIPESQLPAQAKDTLALIRSNGPFPYREDGATFQNREGVLPKQSRGYYREYTVRMPGSPDRGPRRLVVGARHDIYWTSDHYQSFAQVREGR